jgi:hypothetical protein
MDKTPEELWRDLSEHILTEITKCHLSYFSCMTDADTFGDLAEVEMRRRGVSQAKAVCAVIDGVDWRKTLH